MADNVRDATSIAHSRVTIDAPAPRSVDPDYSITSLGNDQMHACDLIADHRATAV